MGVGVIVGVWGQLLQYWLGILFVRNMKGASSKRWSFFLEFMEIRKRVYIKFQIFQVLMHEISIVRIVGVHFSTEASLWIKDHEK